MKYMDAGKSMLRKSKRLFVILTVFCSTILIIKYVQLSVLYMASQEENYQWERVPFYPELTTESITNDLGYPSQTHSCLYYDGLNTFNYIGILRDFPYLLDCVIGIHKVELYESEYQFSTRLILYDEIRYFFGVPIIITKGGIELADEGISMTTIIEFYGPPREVYWSRRYTRNRVLFYCEEGFLIHGTEKRISEIFIFPPVSNTLCKQIFSNEFRFLAPPTPFDVILGPRNPWK